MAEDDTYQLEETEMDDKEVVTVCDFEGHIICQPAPL